MIKKGLNWIVLCVALLLCTLVYGQRSYNISSTQSAPVIDGEIEELWLKAEVATDFVVKDPIFGAKSRFETKVRLLYDDNALYISGEMHDSAPDSVNYALSARDDEGNADWFGVSIDPYGNNVNAFSFMLTSAGVQIDALEGTLSFDKTWNAVWKSATVKTEYGWSFEMKIPYSAIRFPNKKVQEWNVNFWRNVRRMRENSTWNPIDPSVFGEITQSGKLVGIRDIKSPLRLSFTPYATGYVENSYDEDLGKQTWKSRATYGLDIKYGLNDAFTLDMTVIPDFGQTTSDQQILNLGPFEVRFNENRPFFLEGTDLFRIGGVFYSRRIAGRPFNYRDAYNDVDDEKGEEVVSNPGTAPMLNGTKVSGRTKSGLGIGVFNAIEGRSEAVIRDSLGNERKFQVNPYSNYNVFVLSQNLKNNSTVSLVNTNVFREGHHRDANVTVGTTTLYSADGNYRLGSNVKLSAISEKGETEFGHAFGASIGKVAGSWRYLLGYGEESDTYDPNDLGFLYANNSRSYNAEISWHDFKPSKLFFRKSATFSVYYEELYKPQLFSFFNVSMRLGGLHKKQLYTFVRVNANPLGEVNHFESREFGKEVKYNPNAQLNWFFTSDYSKRFALDGSYWYKEFFGVDQRGMGFFISPRFRVSDRMMLIWESSVDFITNDYGYVSLLDDAYEGQIMMGTRDREIVENVLKTEFIFTNRMSVDLRLRHYWQQVEYEGFRQLLDEGEMVETNYNPLEENGASSHNTSYNAFTVDVNYTWVFLPGSELRIFYKNNLFHSKDDLDVNYFGTFEDLFDQPQINSISARLLFFIDALYFRSKNKKNKKRER